MEAEKVGKIQEKYIRWTLGLDFDTRACLILEETKTDKVRIEAENRAIKYEETAKRLDKNKIIQDCWRKIDEKQAERKSKWEEMGDLYYRQKIMDIQEMEMEGRRGREFAEELAQRDRAEQVRWQYDTILASRYNAHYTETRDNQRANYLNGNYRRKDQSMIARFRCGNEERGSKYWKEEKETVCRLCKELKKENSTIREILKKEEEEGSGCVWFWKKGEEKKTKIK